MIRKLTENDRLKALEYLSLEPTYNIFIIGDIEHFGFDSDFQTIYGELDENGNYLSILLFYRIHGIYYSQEDRFNPEYKNIFNQHTFNFMSGKESLMKLVHPHLPSDMNFKPMYFAEAVQLENPSFTTLPVKQVQSKEDIKKLYHLLCTIDEFSIKSQSLEEYTANYATSLEMGMTLAIEEDGIFVSTVATTAETTINAMVIGVATHKDYRKKGYASILMTELMNEYFQNKRKSLCLFYDNPKAGKIYQRLGFKEQGIWVMSSNIE